MEPQDGARSEFVPVPRCQMMKRLGWCPSRMIAGHLASLSLPVVSHLAFLVLWRPGGSEDLSPSCPDTVSGVSYGLLTRPYGGGFVP